MLMLNTRGALIDWHFDAGVVEDPLPRPPHMEGCGWVGTSGESMMMWDHYVSNVVGESGEDGLCTTEFARGPLARFPGVSTLFGAPLDWDPRCERYGVGAMADAVNNDKTGVQSRILDAWFDYHVARLRAWEWLGAMVRLVGVDVCTPQFAANLVRPLRRPLVVKDYGKDAPRSNGSYEGWCRDLSDDARSVAYEANGLMPVVMLPTSSGKVVRLSALVDATGVYRAQDITKYAASFAAQHRILSARAERMPGRGQEDYVQSLRVDSLLAIETWDPRYTKLSTWLYEKWQHSNTKVLREYKSPENRRVDEDLVFVVDPWKEADARLSFAVLAKKCRKTQAAKINEYLSDTGGDDTLVFGNRHGVYALRQISTRDEGNAMGRKIRSGGLLEFRVRRHG